MRIPDPIPIAQALPEGTAIILRDYTFPEREQLAHRLRSVCAARSVLLLISEDVRLARKVHADGLHLPARALTAPPDGFDDFRLLSASCHNAEELTAAAALKVSVALLSPAFATESHPGAKHLGQSKFNRLAENSKLPVLALGGVDESISRALAGPNVAGLAGIGAFVARSK